MGDWEAQIAELGIKLPDPLPPGGKYNALVIDEQTVYTSGIVAVEGPPLRLAYKGRLGDDLEVEDGKASAEGALLSTLGNLRGALGDLNRIERFLKVTGFVRATPDFEQAPTVLDGASELLAKIFGEELLPARSAVGVAALPGGASVEIDTILRLRE